MSINRILVGADFSPAIGAVTREAIALGEHLGSGEVVFVSAVLDTDLSPPVFEASSETDSFWSERMRNEFERTQARLAALCSRYEKAAVRISSRVVEDYPDTALVSAALEMQADLVVVGAPGRWHAPVERVIRRCGTNVLASRASDEKSGGYQRVVVATDFSTTAAKALEMALSVAAPGTAIDVVHCLPIPSGEVFDWHAGALLFPYWPVGLANEEWSGADASGLRANATRLGKELVAKFQGAAFDLSFKIIADLPPAGIVAHLESSRADLVVVGSHGFRGLRRLLVGSVAEAVVRRAPCSVLVVRPTAGGAY